jgi:signal transduction histidine kinase
MTKDFFKGLYREEEDIEEMVQFYRAKYLEMGLRILWTSFIVSFFIIAMSMYLLTDSEEPYRKRILNLGGMHFLIFSVLKLIQIKFPDYLKHAISACLMIIMISITNVNLKQQHFKIYEPMFFYVGFLFLWNSFLSLNSKFLIVPHLINMMYYTIRMSIKAEDFPEKRLPPPFYIAVTFISIMIPLGSLIQGQQFRNIIRLLKENEELINTIRAILEMFPEAVIIQSHNQSKEQWDIEFVNNTAKNRILTGKDSILKKKSVFRYSNGGDSNKQYDLIKLLDQQNWKLEEEIKKLERSNAYCDVMVEMIEPPFDHELGRKVTHEESVTSNLHLKSMQVTWQKNKQSFMHIFVDTTSIKKLEEEKAKIKCQNIMLASVSHEFRTPLNSFDNSLQLMKFKIDELISIVKPLIPEASQIEKIDEIDSKILKFLKIGSVSSKLLLHLVEDILDLGKFESGMFSLNKSEFTVNEIIEDLSFIFETQCRERGLQFTIQADKSITHKKFISDHGRIKQVLINLLSNALKFTQKGSIKVKITETESKKLKFVVCDTGVGIPLNDQRKLFKMFSMLDQHKNKLNQKGTGIGLAISKKIVESLEGNIMVESEVGKYSKFTFTVSLQTEKKRRLSSRFTAGKMSTQQVIADREKFWSKVDPCNLTHRLFQEWNSREESAQINFLNADLNDNDCNESKTLWFESQLQRNFLVNHPWSMKHK